jgi:phosphoribosylformylglycinamidine cyclo-ligase
LESGSWVIPPVFAWLEKAGSVQRSEMYRTFNCGIGFVLVVPQAAVSEALDLLTHAGESATVIGQVSARSPAAPGTVIL